VAAVALIVATHGPLPLAQSVQGLWLSIAIAPIVLLACMAIARMTRLFSNPNQAL
jgi:hypothetical protein